MTVDVVVPSALTGPVPVIVVYVAEAVWVNATVPPLIEIGEVRLKVFVSAFDDFRVQVETPEAFDDPHAP